MQLQNLLGNFWKTMKNYYSSVTITLDGRKFRLVKPVEKRNFEVHRENAMRPSTNSLTSTSASKRTFIENI